MSAQPPLFPAAELVSAETRRRWAHHVAFLWEHGAHIREEEARFLTNMKAKLGRGEDLTLKESRWLGKIFHREEERIG